MPRFHNIWLGLTDFTFRDNMDPEGQVGDSMRKNARPESACPVQEEGIGRSRHHASQPQMVLNPEEHDSDEERTERKRPQRHPIELRGDHIAEEKGAPEEFFHDGPDCGRAQERDAGQESSPEDSHLLAMPFTQVRPRSGGSSI